MQNDSPVRSAPMVDGRVADVERERIERQAPIRPASGAGRRSTNASAVITRAQLARGRTAFERVVGFGLLIGSVAGSILALNGGVVWPVAVTAFFGGAGIQALLTIVQWFYRPQVPPGLGRFTRFAVWCRGLTWKYVTSVLLGTGLSVAGYRMVLHDPILGVLGHIEWLRPDGKAFAAWILLIVVSLIVEVIPENILID